MSSELLLSLFTRLDMLMTAPQSIKKAIPRICDFCRLTLKMNLSKVAQNKGVKDQIVDAMPGFRPAFSLVLNVSYIAQKMPT